MSPFPIDPEARKRLNDAQHAETDALKAVEATARARARAQAKLDTANAGLIAAKVALIACSGLTRAALLLDEDEASLRRALRVQHGAAASGHDQ